MAAEDRPEGGYCSDAEGSSSEDVGDDAFETFVHTQEPLKQLGGRSHIVPDGTPPSYAGSITKRRIFPPGVVTKLLKRASSIEEVQRDLHFSGQLSVSGKCQIEACAPGSPANFFD